MALLRLEQCLLLSWVVGCLWDTGFLNNLICDEILDSPKIKKDTICFEKEERKFKIYISFNYFNNGRLKWRLVSGNIDEEVKLKPNQNYLNTRQYTTSLYMVPSNVQMLRSGRNAAAKLCEVFVSTNVQLSTTEYGTGCTFWSIFISEGTKAKIAETTTTRRQGGSFNCKEKCNTMM